MAIKTISNLDKIEIENRLTALENAFKELINILKLQNLNKKKFENIRKTREVK